MLNRKIMLMLIVCFVLIISACQRKDQVKMIVPYGSTHISQVHLMDLDDYQTELVLGPEPLIAAFGSESYDVIFAPLTLGVKMYNSKPTYKLLATIIESTFYLITTDQNIEEIEDVHGKEVTIFGKGQTGDMMTSYVFDTLDIEVDFVYVDTLSDAATSFIRDPEKIVLVSEPIYSKMSLLYDDLKTIHIVSYYEEMTGLEDVPQAAVFVHQRLNDRQISTLLEDLKDSVDLVYSNQSLTLEKVRNDDPNMDSNIFIKSLETTYISLIEANKHQDEIELYLNLILSYNPNILGGSLPPDDFYWK